jgi:tRNA 2-thiouridine synthesizing protein A
MERTADQLLDLRGTPCPMNWVKAKLELEQLAPGERLEILLDDGDAIRNVPRSVKAEGHKILRVTPLEAGFQLLIECAGGEGDPAGEGRPK